MSIYPIALNLWLSHIQKLLLIWGMGDGGYAMPSYSCFGFYALFPRNVR